MGNSLKGTKSHENLKHAFAGESQANRRYLYFARRADIEGYPDVGGLFRDTSEAETGHAFGHLDFLKEVGDPATGVPIGNTEANLKSAIEGETYEYTQMYPGMAKTALKHANGEIYTMMQGPSEFGIGGRLANWDVKNRLKELTVPTLMIGGKYDTMDPKAMEEQSKLVQHGRYLFCPEGSHLAMYDDQQVYMKGVIRFIHDVDNGKY